jgi:cobalt-zinc-cadmium efflux system outer membrane protein
MPMPASQEHAEHHHHGDIKPVEPRYPQLGRARAAAQGELVSLEQMENIARQMNPTLRQAEAEIRAAKARQQQAGLYPNPTVGYTGDEIRGGSVGGGKEGFFVQQTFVTAGKLGLSRAVFGKEAKLASLEADEQRIRVESSAGNAGRTS